MANSFQRTVVFTSVAALLHVLGLTSTARAKDDDPKKYEGYVTGIEVIAEPGKPAVCLAYIGKSNPGGPELIQVTTSEHRVQTVMESAAARRVRVEVMYSEKDGDKLIRRIRMLDHHPPTKMPNK